MFKASDVLSRAFAVVLLCLAGAASGQAQGSCSQPSEVVDLPDAALAAAVREALELTQGQPITCGALGGLRELIANDSGITDLSGLQHASDLRRLDLRGNR